MDDFLWAGTILFEKCIFLDGSSVSIKYITLNIISTNDSLTEKQLQYISLFINNKFSETSKNETEELQFLDGSSSIG